MASKTLIGKPVGPIGLGVMAMTTSVEPKPTEQLIATIKTAVDAGQNVINSATFYGPPTDQMASLKLLRAFYETHPEYADRTVLGVKGAFDFLSHKLSGELEYLRECAENIRKELGTSKKLDIFIPARVPDDVTVEQLMANLVTLKDEGYFAGIGLSEVSAATLKRANAVHPVLTVENELSLFTLDEAILDVVKACNETGTIFTAYSPLGRGILTANLTSLDDLAPDDRRRIFPRFQGEMFNKNLELVTKVKAIAEEKGVPVTQLALAYIMHLSPQVMPLQGSSNAERILENQGAANVKLSAEEFQKIQKILDDFEVQGDRYPERFMGLCLR